MICDTWLWGWWADLEQTLTTDKHVDLKSIAYVDLFLFYYLLLL